jgi:hypothetical protein
MQSDRLGPGNLVPRLGDLEGTSLVRKVDTFEPRYPMDCCDYIPYGRRFLSGPTHRAPGQSIGRG